MRILGIDPGTAITGYGVIEKKGRGGIHIAHGCITTNKDATKERRLLLLERGMAVLFKQYKPDVVAVESLYFFKNLKTALPVSEARGVILLTVAKHKVPLYEFTPPQVKMSVTGYGRAEKKQMQKMVQLHLKLESLPKPDDAADALAVALACSSFMRS
ncbi:MAG: crossover junction endodeoxyribonuclease RuvC [Parcubacteria group bacterium]|nr:crossover junction endodeoxyribonuclease RuvC [Parcubacteria group bacterium]